jgi:hypothetical protein
MHFLNNLFNFRYYAIARPLDYHETMTGTELQPYVIKKGYRTGHVHIKHVPP